MACSKEAERNPCDKWHLSVMKSMDQLRQLKDLKNMNRLLNESLQRKMDELNEVLAAKNYLDEMVISKQNAVNFFQSHWRRCSVKMTNFGLGFVNWRRKLRSETQFDRVES